MMQLQRELPLMRSRLEAMTADADAWSHGGSPVVTSRHHGLLTYTTLWLFNIAMENDPFIDGLPIKSGDFPWLC